MTRRKDGVPATPYRLRRSGFVLEHEHDDLGADTYHDFVFVGAWRGEPEAVLRDWLGRETEGAGYRWLRLVCNNPSCSAVALRRVRAVEVEVNHAFLAWLQDYVTPRRR